VQAAPEGQRNQAFRPGRWTFLRWLGRSFHATTAAFTAGVLLLIAALVYFLILDSWLSLSQFGASFFTGSTWDAVHGVFGAGPLIAGTLLTSGLALLIAVPISLGVAIFLSEVAPPRVRRPLVYAVDLSAAVPSIVYGFWAYIVLVPLMQSTIEPGLGFLTGDRFPFGPATPGYNVLTATIVLTVMIIPTIAAISRESLRAVPRIHRESALSLGATRWETTRLGVLRAARGGIAAGIILGLGRALGETIAVVMVIGNIFILPGTLFSPGSTLATWIVNNFSQSQPGIERSAVVELALILLAITLVVNVIARLLFRQIGATSEEGAPTRRRLRLHRPPHHLPESRDTDPPGKDGKESPSRAPAQSTTAYAWRRRALQEAPRRIRRRRVLEWAFVVITAACVVAALAPFASVLFTAAQYGGRVVLLPSFYTSLPPPGCNPQPGFTCPTGGIGPEIQGTAIMLGIGGLIAVPAGLLAGVYLSEYGRNRFARVVSFLADVMTGVPTIILGVFVYGLFLYFDHNAALSALSGGVALGVLMLPIATRASEEALRTVPSSLREAALALGFPRHRVTLRVVLGCSRSALVTGMLLAASRAAGDTATLLLTAGGSNFWFQNLNTQTAAITPFIFANFGSNYTNLQTAAWGAALVLLALMLVISLVSRLAVPSDQETAEVA
jgi:phosphate transport system permease protein